MHSTPLDTSWSFAPAVLLSLSVYGGIYVWRWLQVRRDHGTRGAGWGRLVLWMTGLLLTVIALLSPLDVLGDQLASAHMAQHLLLADLIPIALILGTSKVLLRPITRRVQAIERRVGLLAHPVVAIVAYTGAMWFWHVPVFYDAAVRHETIHVIEHLTFAASGFMYWWHLISPIRSRMALRGMGPIAYMASTKLAVGALGVLITFYPHQLYSVYDWAGMRLGMTTLNDQGVAGAMMGLEQSFVMGIGVAWLFFRMMAEADRADEREERLEDARATAAAGTAPPAA